MCVVCAICVQICAVCADCVVYACVPFVCLLCAVCVCRLFPVCDLFQPVVLLPFLSPLVFSCDVLFHQLVFANNIFYRVGTN